MTDSQRADLINELRDSYQDDEIEDADLDNKIYFLIGEHYGEMPDEDLRELVDVSWWDRYADEAVQS